MMKNKEHKMTPKTSTCNLYEAHIDTPMRVKALVHDEPAVCQRLREMGFCEFAEIRKVSHGSALICHVCGVNVALSKYLAKNILVEPIETPRGPHPTTGHHPKV